MVTILIRVFLKGLEKNHKTFEDGSISNLSSAKEKVYLISAEQTKQL
jgi:hypothetical protein